MAEDAIARLVSLQEVVRLTGLSASTVRRRVRDGSIKAVQPGGHRTRLLFDAESLGGLLQANAASVTSASPSSIPQSQSLSGPRPRWRDGR